MKYKRIMVAFISVAMLLCIPLCCCAEESVESIIQEKMDGIDFAPLDEMFREINDAAISKLGGDLSFSGMVEKILNGSLEINFDTMFSLLFSLFFSGIKDLLPLILELFVLSILSAVILNLKGSFQEQIGEAIRFVTYLIASALLFQSFIAIVFSVKDIIGSLIRMLQLIMPILLTLLMACGAPSSAGVLQPDSVILASAADGIIINVVLPLILVMTVLVFINNLLPDSKLVGITQLCRSAATWILTIVFTVFSGTITLQGIAAASYDGVSLRTVRYAINNSVPIIGGLVGESMNMLLSCGVLVKNAVGVAALIGIAILIVSPLLNLVAYMFALRIVAAVTAPLADHRLSALTGQLCDVLKMLLGALCGITVTVFILVCIIIGTGNTLL
ncbi:MAG: stage III sporulation protein AE [Clostridiales bacterium]|nr:stage III sporulation protein AE [Clostridiales bacterium]